MKFKEDMSGVIFSIVTFLNKFSFALASIFIFGILGFLNFDTNKEISEEPKFFIIFSYAVVPVILKLLSAFYLKKFEFSEKELNKIQEIITVKERKN